MADHGTEGGGGPHSFKQPERHMHSWTKRWLCGHRMDMEVWYISKNLGMYYLQAGCLRMLVKKLGKKTFFTLKRDTSVPIVNGCFLF